MRISSITKNAGKACNNRLYRHIRTFEKIVKNYFVISGEFSKTKELANVLGKAPELRHLNREGMMKNPVIHDFVTLLFVYNDVMKVSATKNVRNKKMQEIRTLFCDDKGRMKRNKEFFEKNSYIKDAYFFVSSIIEYIDKKNHNPKHTNFL